MTPREVVPCHHSLVPNWKLFQPCCKEHWIENHLRKERLHPSCSHLCLGALGSAGAVGESVLWWIQGAGTCLLRGAGFACLPLHSAAGSGRDDPAGMILQLLHTGDWKMHVFLSPFVSTAPQQGWATSMSKNGVCANFPLFPPPSPHHTGHRRQLEPPKKTEIKL